MSQLPLSPIAVLDENEEYFRPKESCASTSLTEDHFKNSYSVTISNTLNRLRPLGRNGYRAGLQVERSEFES